MAAAKSESTHRAQLIQGRIWSRRVPAAENPREGAADRYAWWSRLYPRLFDPARYSPAAPPPDVGKGCVACLIDTRDPEPDRCPRCRRRLIWVVFEPLAY